MSSRLDGSTADELIGLDPAVIAEVQRNLDAQAREHGVKILLAVESGSRAWGFPSPDSDYDCRFVFVRPTEEYPRLYRPRNVIELPLGGELDINGWDLPKALRLLLKGSAVLIEWLTSPLIYRADVHFHREVLTLARTVARRDLIARHYLHLGLRQYRTYFGGGKDDVPLKKTFYALRPAAALRWLRLHPSEVVAPMHFLTLMRECAPPAVMAALVDELLALKAKTRELGSGPLPAPIAAFIEAEYAAAEATFTRTEGATDPASVALADELLRRTLARSWAVRSGETGMAASQTD